MIGVSKLPPPGLVPSLDDSVAPHSIERGQSGNPPLWLLATFVLAAGGAARDSDIFDVIDLESAGGMNYTLRVAG
jgi:hypothetical protein